MPRIVVTGAADSEGRSAVTLDEYVVAGELGDGEQCDQLIQRVGWAVHDADEAEAPHNPANPRLPHQEQTAGRLAEIAHAVRDHEDTTRSGFGATRTADARLYRRLRQAFER